MRTGTMQIEREPCAGCPWRKNTQWSDVPGGVPNLEKLTLEIEAGKDPELFLRFGKVMQCHSEKRERVCTGFAASEDGEDSLTYRYAQAFRLAASLPGPVRTEIHATWSDVLDQKGEP